jgi:hypothetical protein
MRPTTNLLRAALAAWLLLNFTATAGAFGVRRSVAASGNGVAHALFRDEFNAATGTANAGRMPSPVNNTNAVWRAGVGAWTVQGNHLEPSASFADGDYQVIDARASDFTYTVNVTGYHGPPGSAKSVPGILFRFEDANNFWLAQMDTAAGTTTLFEKTAGVFNARATINAAQVSGQPVPLTVTAVGPVINMQLPGQTPVQYTSAAHRSATLVGVRVGRDAGASVLRPRFDDVTVFPAFRRSGNSIVTTAKDGWEATDVAASGVAFDARRSRYVMLYSGFDGARWCTGVAYASKPAGPWKKEATNPRLCPVAGEGYIAASASRPVYRNGLWYIVYQGAPGAKNATTPGVKWRVYAASSPDLLKWTRLNSGAPILPLGAPGSFDADGQHDPDLRLRSDGRFEVFFSGRNGGVMTAGHSLSPNMTSWSATAQLAVQGQFGAGTDIGNVSVSGDDPTNYSLYFTHNVNGGARYVNRSDTSDGGATFNYYDGVLYKGSGWESSQVFDPDALTAADALYLFYAGATLPGGSENLNAGIGVATLPTPTPTTANTGPTYSTTKIKAPISGGRLRR